MSEPAGSLERSGARPLGRALAGLRRHEAERETVQEPGTGAGHTPPARPAAGAVADTAVLPEEQACGFPAPSAGAPARVGEYRIVGELGRGGAGVVYVARGERLDRLVALKLLRAERADQAEMRERFEIEARSAARLRHPNIVGIHEVGEDGPGRPFLVMELVPGRSLAAHLRAEGPLPAREAARLVERLARALAYAHGRGVLHRDVKPANVLLAPDGEPLLTDFGLAKVLEEGAATPTVTGQVMGTPAYMPPEQARGEAVDPRSDVYSLGATLYELLCGRPPFDAPSVAAILTRVTGPAPATSIDLLRRGLDRDLATVCMRALEKEPAERYRGATELAEDLARWLRDEPVQARPPGALERLRKWLRRNPTAARTLLGSGLVAGTLGLAGGVAFLRQVGAERDRAQAAADRAEEAAERERQEAARAQAAAVEARLALDALINEVQEQLHDLPGEDVRQARRRLLEQAALGLRRLQGLGVTPADGGSAVGLERRQAALALAMGRTEQAEQAITAAVEQARQLAAAHPQVEQLRWDLMTTLGIYADVEDHAGRDDRSRAALEAAAELQRELRRTGRWDDQRTVRACQLLCRVSESRGQGGDGAGSLAAAADGFGLAFGRPDLSEPDRSRVRSETASALARALARGDHPERALPVFEGELTLDRALLARAPSWQARRAIVLDLLDLSAAALDVGQARRAHDALEEAIPLARELLAADPDGIGSRRVLFTVLLRRSLLALEEGALESALELAGQAVELVRSLSSHDPEAAALRDDESAALDVLGQAHERRGEIEAAGARFEEALALDRGRLSRAAGATEAKLRLINALRHLVDVRRALGDREGAVAATEEGLALLRSLPSPDQDLLSSFLAHRAELCLDQRDLDGAERALQEVLALRRAALAAQPARLPAIHALAWSLQLRADLCLARQDLAGAELALEEALALLRRGVALAPSDLVLGNGLGNGLSRLGELRRRQDRPAEARAAWEEALALRRAQASADPGSLLRRRDVLVLLSRLADLRRAGGDVAGAREALEEVLRAQRELGGAPDAPAAARRDLGVALLKAGEARQAAQDLDAAAEAFEEGTAVLVDLADQDPGDVFAQRDLFGAAQRLLVVRLAQRRLDEALAAAEHLLHAARASAAAQDDAPAARRDVTIALLKRADVHQARGERAEVLGDLRAAVENHRQVVAREPRWAPELERIEAMLAGVEAAGE